MKRWRWALSLFAIVAIAAFAVACGDDDDDTNGNGGDNTPAPTTDGGDGETPEATAEPTTDGGNGASGGEITIQYSEFQSFDPHYAAFAQDIGHQTFVWRGLFKIDEENNPVPEMAAAPMEVSDDGLTVTVDIKPDLLWSDGEPLTVEDFVLGIHRTCNPDNAGQYVSLLANLAGCDEYYGAADATDDEKETLREAVGVEAVDEDTIQFTLLNPQPTFGFILSLWLTWPVPSHIVPDPGEEWPAPTELAFNGPFMVESYSAAESMVFVRNDNYANDPALLDRITMRYISDNSQSNNAYRSGELDMVLADTANLNQLKQEFPDELLSYVTPTTIGIEMQMENEIISNFDVRLAISQATDREAIANNVRQGSVIASHSWLPEDIAGDAFESFEAAIGFDPEAARASLERAGYPDGEGFPVLSYLISDTPANRLQAEFLQAEYKEHLNIDIEIEVVDPPTRSARFLDEQFELFPGGWHADFPDGENWIIGLFDTGGSFNKYNCSDPEIDALIEDAKFNTDNDERLAQYAEVNELIVTRLCGIAPIYASANHILINPDLKGYESTHGVQDRLLAGDWSPEKWYLEN